MGKCEGVVIVGVTTLGSTVGGLGRAAGQVVDYLEGAERDGSIEKRRSQAGSSPHHVDIGGPAAPGSYYADSAERPGVWRGSGADHFALGSSVDAEMFRRVLLGQDPATGAQLVGSQGSNGRAAHHSPASGIRRPQRLTADQVADVVGVDVSYVRRLAARTAAVRAAQTEASKCGELPPELPASYIDASKDSNGRWLISRGEAERFAAGRGEAKVVMGYDITWSVPKSVSALHARGDATDRAAVDDAVEAAVAAGMTYLEADGFHVRRGRGREKATNLIAGSYRHYTNRVLEPQLHEHVVVANMATNSRGETQAIDARGLFAHATTASYIAAAELRNQLTRRLGIEWGRSTTASPTSPESIEAWSWRSHLAVEPCLAWPKRWATQPPRLRELVERMQGIVAILQSASTEDRRRFYEAAQLSITYDHSRKMAKFHAPPNPEVWSSVRVGGASVTNSTRGPWSIELVAA